MPVRLVVEVGLPLDAAVDGGSADGEEFSELLYRVRAGSVHFKEMSLLRGAELRLSTLQVALRSRDLHALFGPGTDEIRFELRDHRQDVEEQPANGVTWIVNRPPDVELDVLRGQLVDDVLRVAERPREPIQLRDDEGVAVAAGSQGFAEPWSSSVRAGQPMVGMDVGRKDAEPFEGDALSGEVLFVCGHACVSDT